MRKDISQVVITTKRWGDKLSRVRRIRREKGDLESLPRRESIRPKGQLLGWDAKHYHLGENLGALKRFVESKVGQHWDSVYAGICEHLNRSSTTHAHIFQHLFGYIETKCYWKDGVLYSCSFYGDRSSRPYEVMPGEIYVCPKSGMIRRMKQRRSQPKKKEAKVIRVNDLEYYEKHEGIWYLVCYRMVKAEYPYAVLQRPRNKPSHPGWMATPWRKKEDTKVVDSRKQLNKRELKRLNLSND